MGYLKYIILFLLIFIQPLQSAYYPVPLPSTSGNVMKSNGSKWTSAVPPAIGSTGYIQYNTSGNLDAEANLFWDSTNNRLGINTASPVSSLSLKSSTSNDALTHQVSSTAGEGAQWNFQTSQGSVGSETDSSTSQILGDILFAGYASSSFRNGALIRATQSGSYTSNSVPSVLSFYTGDGTNSIAERVRIEPTGLVGIGTSATTKLHLYDASSSLILNTGDSTVATYNARHSSDATAPDMYLRKTRGSVASPSAVATSDVIGRLLFQAYGGSNYRSIAYIQSVVDTYTSDTDISSRMSFFTTPTGSVTASERMRIDPAGNLQFFAIHNNASPPTNTTQTISSGTYSPTLTNGTNIAASTTAVCNYSRVGNVVTVSGYVEADPTSSATDSALGVSIPIASNFTLASDARGTASVNLSTLYNPGIVLTDTTNDRVEIRFSSVSALNQGVYFTFQYLVK